MIEKFDTTAVENTFTSGRWGMLTLKWNHFVRVTLKAFSSGMERKKGGKCPLYYLISSRKLQRTSNWFFHQFVDPNLQLVHQ